MSLKLTCNWQQRNSENNTLRDEKNMDQIYFLNAILMKKAKALASRTIFF